MSKRNTMRAMAAVTLAAALALAACGKGKGAEEPTEGTADDGQLAAQSSDGAADGAPAGADDSAAAGGAAEEKRAHCVRAIEHVLTLVEARGAEITDDQRTEALGQGADQCARDATSAELDCVLEAGDVEAVEACDGGGV